MLRYILIFLLINTYGRSLGVPVGKQDGNGKIQISNSLSDLTKQCKNEFVSSQITLKMKDCSVEVPPLHDIQMQCLMFYDASSLLCNTTDDIQTTDFTVKTSNNQNVSVFCNEAAHFPVPPTTHQKMITKVFQVDALCKNVCADEDVLTGDTHFVCKYYKWTLELLQLLKPTVSGETGAGVVGGKANDATTVNNSKLTGQDSTADIKPGLAPNLMIVSVTDRASDKISVSAAGVMSSTAPRTDINTGSASDVKPGSKNAEDSHQIPADEAKKESEVSESKPPTGQPGNSKTPGIPGGDVGDKPDLAESFPEQDAVHDHAGSHNVEDAGGENDDGSLGAAISTISSASLTDGDDGNADGGGDDDDDAGVSDFHVDVHNNQKGTGKQAEPPEIVINDSQRDFFPNGMPDGFTDDDDHFFPFFLTAVIVVIILYVLYHNKNKVGKMFFGLIVEGRQTGRRRNSRGHAYRRLDTLEQAMGSNTAAPPSKIIY